MRPRRKEAGTRTTRGIGESKKSPLPPEHSCLNKRGQGGGWVLTVVLRGRGREDTRGNGITRQPWKLLRALFEWPLPGLLAGGIQMGYMETSSTGAHITEQRWAQQQAGRGHLLLRNASMEPSARFESSPMMSSSTPKP